MELKDRLMVNEEKLEMIDKNDKQHAVNKKKKKKQKLKNKWIILKSLRSVNFLKIFKFVLTK